jgi:branched-chain amino acid transport system permease protein
MRWRHYLLSGLLTLALAILPLVGLPPYLTSRFIEFFLFAVLALSYDLLLGVTGIVSFGHALFFGSGAYVMALLLGKQGLPLWLVFPLVMVCTGALSAVVGSLSLRVKGHSFAMITLAFAEVGHVVALKWSDVTGGADGMTIAVPSWFVQNATGQPSRINSYWVALVFMVLAYGVVRRMVNSPTGRVWQAVRENEFRAGALGYNTTYYKVGAMAAAGMLAGLTGAFYALLVHQGASPEWLTADYTIQALLMTIIGGAGTLVGPMLGAVVVRMLSYWLAGLQEISPIFEHWHLFFGLAYIAIVMFLPAGIAGAYQTRLQGVIARVIPWQAAGTKGRTPSAGA